MTVKTWCEDHGVILFVISVLMLVLVLMTGCGTESKTPDPGPPPPPDNAFAEIKPTVDKNCGKCHNGSTHPLKFDTAAKLKASKAKLRVSNGTMPPSPHSISDADKQKLLAYLGG